jgi:F-type H+-transporting ATPase subunit b
MIRKALISHLLLIFMVVGRASAAGGEGSLFGGDIGNAIWTLVIFLAVIFVLGKFAWGPLLNSLQQREEFIRSSLEEARRDREEAEKRLQEYSDKLDAARAEAAKLLDEGRRNGEQLKGRIEGEARAEAEKMVERATREIDLAKKSAIKDLYATGAELATDLAGKVLQREISPRDHERLIAQSLDKLDEMDQN